MSITDELREYADKLDAAASRRSEHGFSTVAMKLTAIADRIDEALEGHIELPKDVDGMTIHLGERVQLIGNDPSTVSHMHLADDGWRVFVKYDGGLGMGNGKPESIRHVQPDSWECIVRCRDCKRFSLDNSDHDYRSGWWCHRWNTDMVKPDGFCAWGERREA